MRSSELARIDLSDVCFYDLVPERFLLEYYSTRNKITKHVSETYDRPKNYDFLVSLSSVMHDIRYRKLNVDLSQFSSFPSNAKTKALFVYRKSASHRSKDIVCDIRNGLL